MRLLPTMVGAVASYRSLIEVVEARRQFASSPLNGSNIDGIGWKPRRRHDRLRRGREAMAFMIILRLKFICAPRARELKVGTAALVQHGYPSIFCISFCSVGVKSSDHSQRILSLHHNGGCALSPGEGDGLGFELPVAGCASFELRGGRASGRCTDSNRVGHDEDPCRALRG